MHTVVASYGPDDASPVRQSAERCSGKFLDLSEKGDVEAAEAVASEEPEIFVDLMAHTTGARCDPSLKSPGAAPASKQAILSLVFE